MSIEILARRGDTKVGEGVEEQLRLGGMRQLIVNDVGLGRYFEMVASGRVYTTMVKAVTIAATHNSPIAVNTATPVIGLANDPGSGKAAVLLRVAVLTTSGTPAGGQIVLNVQPSASLSSITATATGSIFNNLPRVGASPQGSAMRPYNNVALTGWLAGPNAVQEHALMGGAAAAAAAGDGGPGVLGEDLGGLHIIPPGSLAAIMAGSGAGTTWIMNASLTWAEIDWPL